MALAERLTSKVTGSLILALFTACICESGFAQPLAATGIVAAKEASPELTKAKQVDELFAKWEKSDTPGGVVAIIKDGKTIYSRGYGMASLDYDIHNTPSTVFLIGSTSKQFTAFAIHLLAQEGKLSVDDDARKYLPELHDFGTPITIQQLLHHTSGLRDFWDLAQLAGWHSDDAISEQDVLNLIWRQRDLNFKPGDRELYSNTGYTLLGLIVQRVSGMSLADFTQERIFKPLGMAHSHFEDNYSVPIRDRAYSYWPVNGSYLYEAASSSVVGQGGLYTTVEDLARWDENFYDGHVGGKTLLAEMQVQGRLNNGKTIDYASGLFIGDYRGLKIVEHPGNNAGYNANLLRFPDQHFSVVVLSNAEDLNPISLSRKIADIYLGDEFTSKPAQVGELKQVQITVDPKILDAYVGEYELNPTFVITFTKEKDQLMAQVTGQAKIPVFPASENTFFWKNLDDIRFTFGKPSASGEVEGGVFHQRGRDTQTKRIQRVPFTEVQLEDYAGDYYSDELNVVYEITSGPDGLLLRFPRRNPGDLVLHHATADNFRANYPIGLLQFTRDRDGACSGFTINAGRTQNLRFSKITITPIGAPLP